MSRVARKPRFPPQNGSQTRRGERQAGFAATGRAIKATRTAGLRTFLVTQGGKPFSDAGFGNKMREWCDQAKLPECSSHGLKKIAATIRAEAGATDRQMMALFDWSSEKMASVYTSKANKVRLAQAGAATLATFSLDALISAEDVKEAAN